MSGAAGSFNKSRGWDPLLIIAQIVCVQCCHYLLLSALLLGVSHALSRRLTLHQLFSPYALHYATTSGLYLTLVIIVAAFLMAFVFELVVQRARRCLDFAVTLHALHVVACIVYTESFPTWWYFWLVQSLAALVTAIAAHRRCRQSELYDIPRPQQRAMPSRSAAAAALQSSLNSNPL
jgi:hypothetical protein